MATKRSVKISSETSENSDNMITISYFSVTLHDEECIIMLNFMYNLYYDEDLVNEMHKIYNISFIGPVLKSSDGEVRTFGMHSDFSDFSTTLFIYHLNKSEYGSKLINNISRIDWHFNTYLEKIRKYDIDITDINKIPRTYSKLSFKYLSDNNNQQDIALNHLINYYCYIKYAYGKDLSNIELKDQQLIKYIDSKISLEDNDFAEILKIYYDKFYQPYELAYSSYKKILKITLDKHSIEWDYNKFLSYLVAERASNQVRMYSFLPYYQYFRYIIDTKDFVVDDKLLFKLKFNSNKEILKTNVFLGQNRGKSFYQNLLDIKNNSPNAIIFDKIDYHNLLIMNIFNLRFLHITGILHNDLHLNNVLFQKEPEFVNITIQLQALYHFKLFGKYYLHLGKIDFTIIDFGRACYIHDKDVIMKRIKKVNKDFYTRYYSHLNDMFEKDTYTTGYIMSLFDYIEYAQSIQLGFKWVNDTTADYELLNNVINYCYEILETYLTGNNKRLSNKIYKILEDETYRIIPDIIHNFNPDKVSNDFEELINLITDRGGFHPIDLVIEKYFPDNIYKKQDVQIGIYQTITNPAHAVN